MNFVDFGLNMSIKGVAYSLFLLVLILDTYFVSCNLLEERFKNLNVHCWCNLL